MGLFLCVDSTTPKSTCTTKSRDKPPWYQRQKVPYYVPNNNNNNNYNNVNNSKAKQAPKCRTKCRVMMMEHWKEYLAVSLVGISCYVNAIWCDFVHDDIPAVVQNRDVTGQTSLTEMLKNDFWGSPMSDPSSHKSYRPLTTLSFRSTYALVGLEPVTFHICNIILHVLASILFTRVCLIIVGFQPQFAAIAGALFAAHPIHTEAVTGVVGRADVLACIFFLLSFLSYHGERDKHNVWKSVILATISMFAKETGIVVLVLNLFYDFYRTWHQLRRTVSDLKWNEETIRFSKRTAKVLMSLSVLIIVRLALLQGSLPKFSNQDNPTAFHPCRHVRFLTFCYLAALNCWLLLFPATLSHDWQMGSVPLVTCIGDSRNLATCIFFGFLFMLVYKGLLDFEYQKQPALVLGLLFLILPFLPASNIAITVGFVVAERVLYIPRYAPHTLLLNPNLKKCGDVVKSVWTGLQRGERDFGVKARQILCTLIGLDNEAEVLELCRLYDSEGVVGIDTASVVNEMDNCEVPEGSVSKIFQKALELGIHSLGWTILVVYGLQVIKIRYRQPGTQLLCLILIVVFCGRCILRNRDWMNRESLVRSGLKSLPHNAKMHYNFANFLRDNGQTEDAANHYKEALRLWPTYASAHNNLGTLMSEAVVAEGHFLAAIRYSPHHVNAHYNLGQVYRKANRTSEALWMLQRCIALDSSYTPAYMLLAKLHDKEGNHYLTGKLLRHVIQMHPKNPDHYVEYAFWLQKRGFKTAAWKFHEKALTLQSTHKMAFLGAVKILRSKGQHPRIHQLIRRILLIRVSNNLVEPFIGDLYLENRFRESKSNSNQNSPLQASVPDWTKSGKGKPIKLYEKDNRTAWWKIKNRNIDRNKKTVGVDAKTENRTERENRIPCDACIVERHIKYGLCKDNAADQEIFCLPPVISENSEIPT